MLSIRLRLMLLLATFATAVYSWSEALAVNDDAPIVGTSYGSLRRTASAFLWEDGKIVDLSDLIDPASGSRLLHAEDLNNRGQIAGYGRSPEGNVAAILLTPVPESSSLTLVLLLVGGLAIHFIRRRALETATLLQSAAANSSVVSAAKHQPASVFQGDVP
mgnify:CR=1 FL=1